MKEVASLAGLLMLLGTMTVISAQEPSVPVSTAGPTAAPGVELDRGKSLYLDKCSSCHGPQGDGKGPDAAKINLPPRSFATPQFWRGDVAKKIQNAVENGKGLMAPKDLKADEIRAVITYMSQTFKPNTTP